MKLNTNYGWAIEINEEPHGNKPNGEMFDSRICESVYSAQTFYDLLVKCAER